MPLCTACKSMADIQGRTKPLERVETLPPHGMEWGNSCDRCGLVAGVTINV